MAEAKEKIAWYDIPDVSRRPLSEKQIAELRHTFETPGWKCFMEISRDIAEDADEVIHNLRATANDINVARYSYASALFDLTFQERIERGVQAGAGGTEPQPEEKTPSISAKLVKLFDRIFRK